MEKQGVILGKPEVVKSFRAGPLIQSIRKRVSKRLGLKDVLTDKQFRNVFRGCAFGFAIDGESPWCAAFSNQELKVLEYLEDLDDFHGDAYGRDINSRMPCALVRDLLANVNLAMRPGASRRSYLHFTHAGAIKPLAAYFGLFKGFGSVADEESVSARPDGQFCEFDEKNDRQWRSGLISPFGANFAFVLHKCEVRSGATDESAFKLMTLLQESPMRVDGCDSELCPVQQFARRYQSALGCDLNRLCRI